MADATVFTELNALSINQHGVFQAVEATEFHYCDGVSSERQLEEILRSASDLSSQSNELQSKIVDWPTEYHLSSSRSNLVRPLKLEGVKRILELGCGCGSISRYFGEVEDGKIQVDAIEGSPIRASLAALRCRDLPNVSISTGNFNQLDFPQDYYDLVLFVGVTEYAGRYSDAKNDQDALQDLLSLAKGTAKNDGVILIAIENRLGLKYVMGACEDHYGVPFVGVENYTESTGIRTYTQKEWRAQIAAAGFSQIRFAYPFPDYKVPTVVVNDSCNQKHSKLHSAISATRSRDYCAPFKLDNEAKMWQGVLQNETLGEYSNSFLIAIGNQAEAVTRVFDFSLGVFPKVTTSEKIGAVQVSTTSQQDVNEKIQHLQHKLDLVLNSRGWKLLNRLRVLFGKAIIR